MLTKNQMITKYDEILLHLTDLELIAESLDEPRKMQMLDMIDSFQASVKTLLDPTGNEVDEDYASEMKEDSASDEYKRNEEVELQKTESGFGSQPY